MWPWQPHPWVIFFSALWKCGPYFSQCAVCIVSLLVLYKPLIMRLEFCLPFLKYLVLQCQIPLLCLMRILFKRWNNWSLCHLVHSNLLELGCNNSIKFLAFGRKYPSSNCYKPIDPTCYIHILKLSHIDLIIPYNSLPSLSILCSTVISHWLCTDWEPWRLARWSGRILKHNGK